MIILSLLLLGIILSGCNLPKPGGDGLPNPIDPPGVNSTASAEGETPTDAPPPTPTLPPVVRLEEGDRYLRNGDWDMAVTVYQTLFVDPGASAEQRIAAGLGAGMAAYKGGDFATSKAVLDTLLTSHPDHPNSARAYFLRGDARVALGDYAGALNDYQVYLSLKPGIVDSYVYERIGDTYIGLGDTTQAISNYELAIAADRYLSGHLFLREKVAGIHRSLGNTDAAIAQYRAILELAQFNSYRAGIDLYIGQTLYEAERFDEAYTQFELVFMTYPGNAEALSALRALLEANYLVDQYQRGLVNYNQGQYDIALVAFHNYIAGAPLTEVRPEAHFYIAKSYRAIGNLQAAQSELQGLLARWQPQDNEIVWGDAWLERASVLAEMGDTTAAFSLYDTLIDEFNYLPQTADAIYLAGVLAESLGDTNRATGYYQRLATDFPIDTRPANTFFRMGVVAYQSNDFNQAMIMFTAANDLPVNENEARSQYWLGKTALLIGRTDVTTAALNRAIELDAPAGYYDLRANDLLNGTAPFAGVTGFSVPADPDEGRAEAEAWLVAQFALEATPPLAETLRADIATDSLYIRGMELWSLGMQYEAKQNFETIRADLANDPLATYQLAIMFRDIGLYRSSILAVNTIYQKAGVHSLEGPIFLARLRHPVYYDDLIIPAATTYGLDPVFVYGLIRQESAFEGFAVSFASAQGLMQIWPPTGEDIAERLAWPAYTTSELQRPMVSVAFGTWLIQDEMTRFNGDPYAVLTAYNAGTGNAARWQDEGLGDWDLFLEAISLNEPQRYVRAIYEHYTIYGRLYGDG